MKALSIVALIFAAISIFVPVVGIFIAMGCSVLALITFCKQPTLSGITFGINIISTTFLSPTLALTASDMHNTGEDGVSMYLFYVGFHVVLMLIAFITLFIFKKKKKQNP